MDHKYIELFAGCGGMSLGLKAAGFKLYFANEFSPMAGETFAFNILGENLREKKVWEKTIWIKSKYEKGDPQRLREDPRNSIKIINKEFRLEKNLEGKLIIGDINDLIAFIKKNTELRKSIKGSIDLISGGPPCQSFSLAGKRDKNNKRNNLPLAFAEFARLVQPKIVLLENVSGILRPFKEGNNEYIAWFEVAKAFAINGFIPICMHINAKYFGLPQNRPRFILLGINNLYRNKLSNDPVLVNSLNFYDKVKKGGNIRFKDIEYKFYELNNEKELNHFISSDYLPKPNFYLKTNYFRSVAFAIDHLKVHSDHITSKSLENDEYHMILDKAFDNHLNLSNYIVKNHNRRKHSPLIQRRFEFLRKIEELENDKKVKVMQSLRHGNTDNLDLEILLELTKIYELDSIQKIEVILHQLKSKKHSQRCLKEDQPAPAALSIPDDICHYDPQNNRTLTIREMARIQSFPDWFEFRAKDTTGGKNRQYEVPNYTQIGNAVPPLLAKELGEWIKNIIEKISK